jgi:hypothetical protein
VSFKQPFLAVAFGSETPTTSSAAAHVHLSPLENSQLDVGSATPGNLRVELRAQRVCGHSIAGGRLNVKRVMRSGWSGVFALGGVRKSRRT